ncbi:MAG: AAA family ATPase, partial [Anaerolineales bacterium]|nr:AAA family ATPase [Anaerolineales bacterium]
WISQQWETARFLIQRSGQKEAILIIDEVQKIENWSEEVKRLWDEDTLRKINLKVVLLGSSRLLLQKGLSESLAGRYESIYMGHWSFDEINSAFSFTPEQFVWFGGFPGPADFIEQEDRWKNYIMDSLIEPSISKDILMLTRVDKPVLLKRLFELGCSYSGQILSFTKIMGQLADAGKTTTLAHYLHLLDTSGMLAGLEKFSPGILRQRSSSPKFQVHNTALMSAQQTEPFHEIESRPEKWGRWIESAIGAHLLNRSLESGFGLYYWRLRNDEVDFVIEFQGKSIGIEVKSGFSNYTKGMSAFQRQHHPYKVLMVGPQGIPWQEFLKLNPMELFSN